MSFFYFIKMFCSISLSLYPKAIIKIENNFVDNYSRVRRMLLCTNILK